MFCSNCGNKLLDTAKFCGSCGKNVSSTAVIEQEKFSNEKENVREEDGTISNTDNSKAVIKCGNSDFVGQGEPARRSSDGTKVKPGWGHSDKFPVPRVQPGGRNPGRE